MDESARELEGRVAIVTGSGRNIGRAIALALAAGGAAVVVNTRTNRQEADDVARDIERSGGKALACLADFADAGGGAENGGGGGFRALRRRIDILVNNAAMRDEKAFDQLTLDDWRAVMAVILEGAFHCAQACLPALKRSGNGAIVNIGGLSAHTGSKHRAHVIAAKAGVVGLTRALAHDLAADKVTVNCVSPGAHRTSARYPRAQHHQLNRTLSGRYGTPGDVVATMVRFLCGPGARYITGQTIHANGGAFLAWIGWTSERGGEPARAPMYTDLALHIGGAWLNGDGRQGEDVVNPATEKPLGRLPHAGARDLDHALEAAKKGFELWRATSAYDRAKVLRKAANLVRERAETIGRIMTQEQGKVLSEARLEVLVTADIIEWYAEEGRRAYGRIVPGRAKGTRQMVLQEPVGVVAAFTPWNFPTLTPARKIGGSLAAGCALILKASEETPGSCVELGALLCRCRPAAGRAQLGLRRARGRLRASARVRRGAQGFVHRIGAGRQALGRPRRQRHETRHHGARRPFAGRGVR